MKYNQQVIQADFRTAYEALKAGIPGWNGAIIQTPNDANITAPASIVQEQPFINTTTNYTFDFGTNAPLPSAALGNIVLGQNNTFVISAFQVVLGIGALANNRTYFSRGFTANDNSLYNAQLAFNLESNQPVQKMKMEEFYEEGDYINGSAMVPIKPMRAVTGLIARMQVIIQFPNPIAALALTDNLFISVRLHGALGLA